jgi:hypothetical protein
MCVCVRERERGESQNRKSPRREQETDRQTERIEREHVESREREGLCV